MKYRTLLLTLMLFAPLISSCEAKEPNTNDSINSNEDDKDSGEGDNTSQDNSDEETPDKEETEEELFSRLKTTFFEMDKNVVKANEVAKQTNNYGGLNLDTTITSVSTKYANNFVKTNASASMGESSYSYTEEKGIVDNSTYYSVTEYSEGDSDNKAVLYYLGDDPANEEFSVGFASFFASIMVNGIIDFEKTQQGTVTYNFADIDFTTDGIKNLYLKCLAGKEDDFDYKIEIEAAINIEKGLIKDANIVALQSLINDTNYIYTEREVTYETGELTEYKGEKIDYTKYLN